MDRHIESGKIRTVKECKICGAISKCGESEDGNIALCWRVESDRISKAGSYIHRLKEYSPSSHDSPRRASPPKPKSKAKTRSRLHMQERVKSKEQADQLAAWAIRRSVTLDSLHQLGCTMSKRGMLIPERCPTAPAKVNGYSERFETPIVHEDGSEQRFSFRERRGFQFADFDPNQKYHSILIPEGFACVTSGLSAGFYAIGRPTRNADLVPLAKMLRKIGKDLEIIIILENDETKPGRHKTPREEVEDRARQLEEELGRIVLVGSPPSTCKDVNDFYRLLSQSNGHYMHQDDRWAIGEKMHREFVSSARDGIIRSNQCIAGKHKADIEISAEMIRADRLETGQGADSDFDRATSCTYRHVFSKTDGDGKKLMACKLACDRWSCSACRERILIPTWAICLLEAFAQFLIVYMAVIPETQLNAVKRSMQRDKSAWVVMRLSPTDEEPVAQFAIVSSSPIRGQCSRFDFRKDGEFETFASWMKSTLHLVDRGSRPISTSQGISVSQAPSREDWARKLQQIFQAHDELYFSRSSPGAAKVIRSAAYRSKRFIGAKSFDFFAIENFSNDVVTLADTRFPGMSRATLSVENLMSQKIRNDESHIFASPAWTASKTSGWDRTGINAGPSELRETALRLGYRIRDIDFSATSSVTDCATIFVQSDQIGEVLDAIRRS
jgi:hypothetical protein